MAIVGQAVQCWHLADGCVHEQNVFNSVSECIVGVCCGNVGGLIFDGGQTETCQECTVSNFFCRFLC